MTKDKIGKLGEKMAVKFLKKLKYRLLFKNYKTELGEIDIIVTDNNYLVFCEVKTRETDFLDTPAEAVTKQKQRKISQVASQFLKRHRLFGVNCRFDVLEVSVSKNEINHIQDAFDSYLNY